MITCTEENGAFSLNNLEVEDLELIQEAIIRLFNESLKKEHRDFRSHVLRLNRAIDPVLEKNENTRSGY